MAIFVEQEVETFIVVTEGSAMSRHTPLYSWIGQVASAFPSLSRPQATVLALYSFGAILAHRCGLNSVAVTLTALMDVGNSSIGSRLQEFYQPASAKSGTQRRELDVTTCFAPLLTWTLKGWPSNRLALALDATSLGDRFTVLSISVVYRGSASPVAWKIVRANVPHAWKPEWIALLRLFQTLVPAGWTVIVMSDRGLYARWLFQEIVALGWHPLMRITRTGKFRKTGSRSSLPVTAFVSKTGQRWQGRGVAFPATTRLHADGLLGGWSRRTVVRSDGPGAGPERSLVVPSSSPCPGPFRPRRSRETGYGWEDGSWVGLHEWCGNGMGRRRDHGHDNRRVGRAKRPVGRFFRCSIASR